MADARNVYFSFVFIALGGLLFGYIIGINSNVVTPGQLLCPHAWAGDVGTWTSWGYGQCYELSAWEQGLVSSLNLLGAALASLFCFRYADDMGRKREVATGAALYMAGSLVAAAAPVKWAIYLGLLVYGLGIGFAMHAAPIYIAEISPAEIRGSLVSAKEAVIVLGIFMGFGSGALFSGYLGGAGWRGMVGLAGGLALVMEVGITFVHESPRWLVRQAVCADLLRSEAWQAEARESLRFFRRAGTAEEVEPELQGMLDDTKQAMATRPQHAACCETFRYPRPLVIGCGLVLLQQVTGQPSVLYFATNIFKDAGFGSSASLSSVGVGLVKLAATLVTVWHIDNYGRRKLLFIGIAMMVFALLVLGVAFTHRTCAESAVDISECPEDRIGLPRVWAVCTVGALMVYVSGYQVGFGPISWLMISEIFPLGIRGAALSTAAMVNFSSNIAMTFCQAALMSALTPAGLFFAYFALAVVSLVFVWCAVPETKGRTLEEIEAEMTKPSASGDLRTVRVQ